MTKYQLVQPKVTFLSWLVLGIAVSYVLLQFCVQLSSGLIIGGLMNTFGISALGASVLASSYYYIYVALQTPAGALTNKYGPRLLLTIGPMLCAFGAILFATTDSLYIAIAGRLLMGAGTSIAFVCALSLAATWFPVKYFAMLVGMIETIAIAGTLVGNLLIAGSVKHFGWQWCIFAISGLMLLVGLLSLLFVRREPSSRESSIDVRKPKLWHDIRGLLSDGNAWLNGLYSGIMFSIITVFTALWGIPFLHASQHLNLEEATAMIVLIYAGVGFGSPLMGWFFNRLERPRLFLITNALVCAFLMLLIIYLPGMPLIILGMFLVILGFFASTYVINFAYAHELSPQASHSSCIGFANTLSVGIAPIFQPLIGWLLDIAGARHGYGYYTVGDFEIAMSILPIALIIAAGIAYFLPRRRVFN